MAASSFSNVLALIAGFFKQVFVFLDGFYLVGTFSFLDFSVAVLVIDITITAFFVTFNVGVSSDRYTYYSDDGKKHHAHVRSASGSARSGGK